MLIVVRNDLFPEPNLVVLVPKSTQDLLWVNADCEPVLVPEHVVGVESSQPVAVRVHVVVARSSAVTLDEGNPPEVFQTGSRGGQRLTRPLRTHSCFLEIESVDRKSQRSKWRLTPNNHEHDQVLSSAPITQLVLQYVSTCIYVTMWPISVVIK